MSHFVRSDNSLRTKHVWVSTLPRKKNSEQIAQNDEDMGRKIPCIAKEGWVYKGGDVCSKCDKCPGGQGRDMSKQVLNSTEMYGDLECIECKECAPKTYNNGGRKGCKNCFEDCANRNRHDCPNKATQPCGECISGFYEDYQVPDDPSTCNPCTEKEIDIVPACANFTTSAKDGYDFGKNISETDAEKAVEMRNGHFIDVTSHTYGGTGTRIDIILGLVSICSVVAIFVVIFVIYRHCKNRRKRKKDHEAKKTPETASSCRLLDSNSEESGTEIKVDISDTDSAPEEDSEAVPPTIDPRMWEHRTELLRSNNTIWRKCAQQWTELGKEYKVLSITSNTIEQLKKEKEDKQWSNADFCYEILKSWTQIKGDQATVKALCDALFDKKCYEIIETVLQVDV